MSAVAPLRRIVIVGGGTAGWMSAAALAKLLGQPYELCLVESDEIGIIGVGEATIPHIRAFNEALGIDEDEFLRATQGSFKLGIEFVDWGARGERYIHGFGKVGRELGAVPFHHYWLRLRREGRAGELGDYSINTAAPRECKFLRPRPDMAESPLADIGYAYHFDASLYARFLRHHAEQRGVQRIEGRIEQVLRHADDGRIKGLRLASGELVEGDFFIDCSGMRALLIEQTLKAGYEDWSHWLPCDRALAVPSAAAAPLLPYTRSTAHAAGWQWRIPLQHRVGNGHVFSSRFIGEDEARSTLLAQLDGAPLAEPRLVKFLTGRRKEFWKLNCVAVGLASGFMEPLESTSIHLIQSAVTRLIQFFPHAGLEAVEIAEYNRQTQFEYERIRDFIILHYKASTREDSEFWRYCRHMQVPDTLRHKIELFRANGRLFREGTELFTEMSWLQVMVGQSLLPAGYHPFVDQRPLAEVQAMVDDTRSVIQRCVAVMPGHAEFIAAHCAATHPDESH